jgi:hypothetical protein
MIPPPRLGGRQGQVLRSQLALEVALAAYALVAALVVIRVVSKLIGISPLVWTGQALYAVSAPLVAPFAVFSAARRPLLGGADLADLTAVGIVALIPLVLLIGDRRRAEDR